MRRSTRHPLAQGAAICAFAILALATRARAVDEEGCLACHGREGFALRSGGSVRSLAISSESWETSTHAALGCRDCHAEVSAIPHGGAGASPGCGQPCHGGKDRSHEALYWEYAKSAHGVKKIPCLSCHPSPSPGDREGGRLDVVRRCAGCHRENPAVKAWFGDVHFKALVRGDTRAPGCPECHTSHRIHAGDSAESSVGPGRRGQTCAGGALGPARACHGAGAVAAAAHAPMSPLRRPGGGGAGGTLFTVAYSAMVLGLLVRAGVGFLRER